MAKKLGPKFKTTEQVICEIKEQFGDRYIIPDDFEYQGNYINFTLICKLHGEFPKNRASVIKGQGCPKCGRISQTNKRLNTMEHFLKRAKEKHGNKYDYSKVIMGNNGHTKVIIICPKHGEFEQTPASHLTGRGCVHCRNENGGKSQKYSLDTFIKKARAKHGDKFDYSLVEYTNSQNKVRIICPVHGEFEQIPTSHLKYGCRVCACELQHEQQRMSTEEFVNKSIKVHGLKRYDYSLVEYGKSQDVKVKIICRKHGVFKQSPTSHLSGHGCPRCNSSQGENKIRLFFENHNIKFVEQKRFRTCRDKGMLRFDFYVPHLNLLIEFDGIQHYPEEIKQNYSRTFTNYGRLKIRDEIKNTWCRDNAVPLLRIKYDADIDAILRDTILK